jgi:hypothetical protein
MEVMEREPLMADRMSLRKRLPIEIASDAVHTTVTIP